MTTERLPHVVIIGAGFGGLWAARRLAKQPVRITLIDRNNYHTFFPLLYQVAAAELEPEDIAYPVRSIVRRQRNVSFMLGDVSRVDLDKHVIAVAGSDESVAYDYLVLAMGSRSNFFGVPGAQEHAFPLRVLESGVVIRNHILICFEQAVREPDAARRQALLTFVIVGGGPTGVEYTGALAELVRGALHKDFHDLDLSAVRIDLVEAAPTVMAHVAPKLRDYTRTRLEKMGVQVRTDAAVSEVAADYVRLKDGMTIPTLTCVWTAGVRGDPVLAEWGLPTGQGGRVLVQPTLQVPGHPEVYVAGDSAFVQEDGHPLPMVAPAAIQMGEHAARNIVRQVRGEATQPFRYRDPGTLAVIGRNSAVASVWGRNFTGFPAWALWLVIHLSRLIGFRNRLMAMTSWASDYFFFERAVRLILPRPSGFGPPQYPTRAAGDGK